MPRVGLRLPLLVRIVLSTMASRLTMRIMHLK